MDHSAINEGKSGGAPPQAPLGGQRAEQLTPLWARTDVNTSHALKRLFRNATAMDGVSRVYIERYVPLSRRQS
jgi:hypothetical protein